MRDFRVQKRSMVRGRRPSCRTPDDGCRPQRSTKFFVKGRPSFQTEHCDRLGSGEGGVELPARMALPSNWGLPVRSSRTTSGLSKVVFGGAAPGKCGTDAVLDTSRQGGNRPSGLGSWMARELRRQGPDVDRHSEQSWTAGARLNRFALPDEERKSDILSAAGMRVVTLR